MTRKGKPIILCVDDVKEVLDTLDEQLNAHLGKQFSIETCLSGEEALEVIEDNLRKGREIAVIIADVIMPGMKGDELLIRAHQMTPGTLNIMLTGEAGTVQHVTNAINKAKLYRFINKPWDMKDMQLTIEEAAKSYLQRVTIEEQNRVLRTLHDASQVIARQVDLRDIYGEMMRLMLRYSSADKAVLALKNDERLKLYAMAQANLPTQILDGEELDLQAEFPRGVLMRVAETQTAVVQGNIGQEDVVADPYLTKFQVRSFFAFPLINLGKLIGVVYLENRLLPNAFSPERIDVINILASQAAIAIDNGFLYEHLEDEVYRRTKELMAANSHKDKILNIVSHEIRGPLGGIAELAGLLKDPEFARNADEVTRYAELIQTNTSRVVKLANDILELARLETGGTDGVKRTPLELTHLLTSLVPVFQSMTLTKNITLSLDAPEQIELLADSARLSMAMSNLINNALKFTAKGGQVTITAKKLLHNGQPYAEVKVIDTGLGIPADQLPKVFEKFGAKQRLGTAGEKGTGLGLSLVKEIITQHEGKIDVRSEVNKGTIFTILLPIA
jgi:signal transduction histidine kinase/FixJ family two-component response regulator